MPIKGLTIFQKIFFTCFLTTLVTLFFSELIHFHNHKKFIEHNVKSQGLQFLDSGVDFFDKVYNRPVIQMLKIIVSSQALDDLLISRQNEKLIARPNVEKLFLHFTKYYPDKYLSLRFINKKGEEQVITKGNIREKNFNVIHDRPESLFYSELKTVFEKLKDSPEEAVVFSQGFEHNNDYTILAGINKFDPEVSGFAGVVILHISLRGYYEYLSTININGYRIIGVYTADGKTILDSWHSNPHGRTDQKDVYFVSTKEIRGGSENQLLFLTRTIIPSEVYTNEIHKLFWGSLIIALVMILLVMISSYLFSLRLSRPINHLLDGTRRIAGGDFSTQINITSKDEIGLLTDNFNKMVLNLKSFNERLTYDACHDVLTDLPNRTLLLDRLDMLIKRFKRDPDRTFALLFIDLNRFKLVNDSLGHHTGDILLKQISKRFNKVIRSVDTIGRLGGDEFVILIDQINSFKDPQILAERLQKDLERPFNLNGQEIYISCSIGIIMSQKGYEQPSDYLRDADTAMYHAKASNTSHYKLFDESMRSKVLFAMQLEMDLRVALEQKQFVLHYQPIICLKQRKIVRFEALVRWHHQQRGYVYPLDFITNAEETGMIVEIDRWVLGQVCKDIKSWNEKKLPRSQFSINFSAKQFEQRGLIKQIKEILSEHNIEPGYLGIEITESVAMNDVSLSIAVLNQLREMGINISIDDFGMGYSSLNSLKLFPVDHLKIDRHFITDVPQDHERGAIIEAIIVMAHKLGYKVVGEGVETRKQMDFLCKNKCDEGQGYLFSKPVDFNRLEDLLLQPDFKTDFTKKV